jgi:hypothetical protein
MEITFYHKWITSGRKYSDAVDFYNTHGKSKALKSLFALAETPYTRKKIAEEIQQLCTTLPQQPPATSFKQYNQPINRINPETLPETLKAEYYKLGPLIRRISYLQSRLDIIQSDEIRLQHALEIIQAAEERRAIFNNIDYFLKHGSEQPNSIKKEAEKEPTPYVDHEVKYYQLKEEYQRLRVQRSKLKNKPHRQADLNKVVERMEQIDKELTQ